MARSNGATRLARLAGSHYWTAEKFTEGAAAAEPERATLAAPPALTGGGKVRRVNLELPAFPVLIREYFEHVLRFRAPSTRRHQTALLAKAARELSAQPDALEVRSWLGGQVDAGGLMPSSANNYLRVLKTVYSTATDNHGVPNLLRHLPEFPVGARRARAIPADGPGGRLARVERWIAAACTSDVERALLFVLYDAGLRIQEAIAIEPDAIDWARGLLDVRAQRDAHAEEVAPPKTRGSRARVNLSPLALEWLSRALRAPERARWGGNHRGREKRDRLVCRFVFPFTQRGLDNLLRRLRAIDPDCFPRRVRGERSGDAWHVFRHSLASDMHDAGMPVEAIGRRLRHSHFEWTQTYIDAYRGRDATVELDPLEKMRAAQRAALREAAGVKTIGETAAAQRPAAETASYLGRRNANAVGALRGGADPDQAGAAPVRVAAGGPVDPPARGAVKVSGVAGGNTAHVSRLPERPTPGVGSQGMKGKGACERSGGSTSNTGDRNTDHPRTRALPLPPYPLTPRPARRKGGR